MLVLYDIYLPKLVGDIAFQQHHLNEGGTGIATTIEDVHKGSFSLSRRRCWRLSLRGFIHLFSTSENDWSANGDMAYPTEFDGKFRVVPNGCRTLKPDTYVNDDGSIAPSIVDGLFTGLLLDVRDIERDILSQAIGPAFDSLGGGTVVCRGAGKRIPRGQIHDREGLNFR